MMPLRAPSLEGRSPFQDSCSSLAAAADTVPHWWSMLSSDARTERTAAAHKAWDMVWFVHGLSFNLIDSQLFRQAIAAIKQCPTFVPCCRQTLAGSHLQAREADANEFKEARLNAGKRYGFLFTTDGWKNKKRRNVSAAPR